jgi:hypothetical protein
MHVWFIFFLTFLFYCTPGKYRHHDGGYRLWRRVAFPSAMGVPLFFLIWIK